MKSISSLKNIKGKTVLLRSSLNVPIKDGMVLDDFRLRKASKTIKFLISRGARVIIIAHIGRKGTETLAPVAHHLKKDFLGLRFIDSFDDLSKTDSQLVLYENLRRDPREVENNDTFARKLAGLADVFVQDAFSVCHREHTSIVGIPKFLPSYSGLLLDEEIENLTFARIPEHPALFALGGAKFATKEKLIDEFLQKYDRLLLGGALANDFFLASGFEIGESLISDKIPSKSLTANKKILLPSSVIVTQNSKVLRKKPGNVKEKETIVDAIFSDAFLKSMREFKTITWNGPFGVYELGFKEGTEKFAKQLSELKNTKTIIGGGDTIAAIHKLNLENEFSFLSTGGGAMLEFLLKGTLPGIEALG